MSEALQTSLQAAIAKAQNDDLAGGYADLLALIEQHPDDEAVALNLASMAFDLEKFDEASTICEGLFKKGSQHPITHFLYSRLCYLRGDVDGGFEHVQKAWKLGQESAEIALDYLLAARNRYWSLRMDEYEERLERAQAGELRLEEAQRFVHQAFARIIRPEFLALLCNPDEGDEFNSDGEIISAWQGALPEEEGEKLAALWQNFVDGLRTLATQPEWQARAATVTLRDQSKIEVKELADIDPLALGAIEVLDSEGGIGFFPLDAVKTVEFGAAALALPVTLTLGNDTMIKGLTGLATPLSHFSTSKEIAGARKFVMRKLDSKVALPLGARFWRADDQLLPLANIQRIDIHHAPRA